MTVQHRASAGRQKDAERQPEAPAADAHPAPLVAVPASLDDGALARLLAHSPGVSNAAVARLIAAGTPTLARELSDADRERIDDLIQMHTDMADPEFIDEMLAAAEDEAEAEPWFQLLEDPTERAYHYRVVLLLQESTASTTADVDELLGSVEETANDEAATLAAIGNKALKEHAWVFPATWAARVQSTLQPPSDLELTKTSKALSDAVEDVSEAATEIPEDILKTGLPVAFQEALELKSYRFRWSHANLSDEHAVKTYAIAAKAMVEAQVIDAVARGWAAGKQSLVSDIRSGMKVVDTTNWDAFAAPRRGYRPDLDWLTDDAIRDDIPIIETLAAEEMDVRRAELALAKLATSLLPVYRLSFASKAGTAFDAALARANALIAAASADRRLDLADAWADALGYPAAARELMVRALKENAGEMALDVAKDVGLSLIPVFGWIWRAKGAAEEIGDLVSAGTDLMDARDAVEAAKTVVALQRAAARLSLQENASMATVALTVAGKVPGGKKGKAADGGAKPDKPKGGKDADKPDSKGKDADPSKGSGKPDPDPVRIEKQLPDGGTLKLLEDGRLILCHSPCTYLDERYARELGDPTSARRARLAALAQRERDAIAAGDATAEQAVFDDAVAFEDELRQEHRLYLGTDRSATGGGTFRPHEATQAEHIEETIGRPLEVLDPAEHADLLSKKSGDWWDPVGHNTWDGVGGQTHFDFAEFTASVAAHTKKTGLDFLFVDLSGFTEPQRQQVIAHIRATHKAHLNRTARPFIKIYVDRTRGVL